MPAIFVHLSDIHFDQERDERVHIHDDVKQQLIIDAAEVVKKLPGGAAHAILVTGDIAFSRNTRQLAHGSMISLRPSAARSFEFK